jgi:cytochrome c1
MHRTLRTAATLAALVLAAAVQAQSVVKPTGNPPRFPEADKKLAEQTKPPSSNWLLDANDDTERFRRLQIVASGTDIPMWEIAHRFEELHVAVARNNWEMGVYHLEKLRDRMNTAGMKRPARTQNIEAMFLKSGVYQDMHDALTSKDNGRMRTEFQRMRSVCMGCHAAENVGFLNDSAVFKRTEAFPALTATVPAAPR